MVTPGGASGYPTTLESLSHVADSLHTRRGRCETGEKETLRISTDYAGFLKRVYGLKDNTTEHSEYKRLAEQLERPEWAQLRQYWKWAAIEERAHGQKTERRAPDRVRKVKAARKAPTCYGGGTEEDEHGWEYLCEWEGEQSDSWVWHDKMPHTWERELMHAQGVRRQAASFREWLDRAPQKAR